MRKVLVILGLLLLSTLCWAQGTDGQGYVVQGTDSQGYVVQGTDSQGYVVQGTDGQGYVVQGTDGQGYVVQGADSEGYVVQGADSQGNAVQQADSLRLGYVVRGRVVDAASGKPMEAVHVSVPGRNYATVTNADGHFVLKSDRSIERIQCSFLGYRTQKVAVGEGRLTVRMVRENLALNEAILISGDPEAIVRAAAERIWDTYCVENELLQCFYRETLQKRGRYIYVAEAVEKIFKHRYNGSILSDAAALMKSRVLVSQRKTDTLSVKVQGGPTEAILMDAVKNSIVIFNETDLALYGYEMQLPAYIGDRVQFVVRMYPVGEADYPLYNATLYIDREYLTFTRVEMSLDMSNPAKATRNILVRKPLTLRFTPEEATIVLNYKFLEGGRSRLEYYRSTMRFRCDWKKRLFRTRYTAVNELVVTDLLAPAQPIPRQERFKSVYYLSEKTAEYADPHFWEDYNIIEPSESLEHAISRLRKQ